MVTHQDLLDEEIGTPPPSAVDIDGVIVRQRRRHRYERGAVIVASGALAVVAAVAITALPQATGSKAATPGDGGKTHTYSATPTVPTKPQSAEAARLTAELKQLLAADLPDATFVVDPAQPKTEPLVFVDKGDYFEAYAEIKDAQGLGEIHVTVGKDDDAQGELVCPNGPAPQDVTQLRCDTSEVAGGGHLLVISDHIEKHGYQRVMAEIMRSDGNTVTVDVSNGETVGYIGQRPTPPLTKAQTIALAENPGLATKG